METAISVQTKISDLADWLEARYPAILKEWQGRHEEHGLRIEDGEVFFDGLKLAPMRRLEMRLLECLWAHGGRIVGKFEIVSEVWGEHYIDSVDDDRIFQLIKRVRQKIEPEPRHPRFLLTVAGRGYRLVR